MKDSIGIDTEFFICACHSDEHTLKFTFIEDPDYNEIYVSAFLRSDFSEIGYPFWLPWLTIKILDDFIIVPFKRLKTALDRKSTRLNSSHANISYAVFCLK